MSPLYSCPLASCLSSSADRNWVTLTFVLTGGQSPRSSSVDWIMDVKYGLFLLYLAPIVQSAYLDAIQEPEIGWKMSTWLNLHLHIIPRFLDLVSFDFDGGK